MFLRKFSSLFREKHFLESIWWYILPKRNPLITFVCYFFYYIGSMLHHFVPDFFLIFLFCFVFIHRDTEREGGRGTGRGRRRLHAGSLTWDSIPGLQDQALG